MTALPNNKTVKNFRSLQYSLAQHLRDPENTPPPEGIEQRRIAIYQRLVYNGIQSFIASSFPVLRKITSDDNWHCMLRDYIHHHQAHTPLFPKMPLEFLHYLEYAHHQHPEYPDFLLELATYEWAETCVRYDAREIDLDNIDSKGDLLSGIPMLNPIMMPQTYNYPVHKIGPDYLPDAPSATPFYLLIYRRKDDEARFVELNPVSARLIECIQGNDEKTGMHLLQTIADELQHPDPQTVIKSGYEIMCEMHDKEIILGVHSS